MYDLTHQASKDSLFNLTKEERVNVLSELKKHNMPVSNIRNITLKKLYINVGKKEFGESSLLSSGSEEETYRTLNLFKVKKIRYT